MRAYFLLAVAIAALIAAPYAGAVIGTLGAAADILASVAQ